jgi:excisionase family DNA binding protein
MYLNVQRAALRLGVAPHTVRRWTASGLLPCTRTPGGHRRIREEDVDALALQIGGSNHMAARRAREREVDTLLETSLALVSRLELTDLLKEIAKRLTRLMDCHFCAISAYDEESRTVTMLADFDDGGRRLPDLETYALSRYPLTRQVLEDQVTAVVNLSDPAADPDELRELMRDGDKSLLMVPMVHGGRSIGLLELMDHLRERRYSRQELRICSAIAGQAAVALHNAETYAEARAANREIEEICAAIGMAGDSVAAMARAADVGGLLEAAARSACEVFGGVSCVASAGGMSAGFTGSRPGEAAGGSGSGDTDRRLLIPRGTDVLKGTDVLTVTDASGPFALTLTLSLPRPTGSAEPQLLGMLAAVVGSHLARLRPGDA